MTDSTRALLARLRATAEAATPGPWETDEREPAFVYSNDATGSVLARCAGKGFEYVTRDRQEANANAAHIATFDPPTIQRLLAIVEAAFALTQVSDYEGERRPDIAFRIEFNRICAALAALGGSDHG